MVAKKPEDVNTSEERKTSYRRDNLHLYDVTLIRSDLGILCYNTRYVDAKHTLLNSLFHILLLFKQISAIFVQRICDMLFFLLCTNKFYLRNLHTALSEVEL